MFLPLLAIDPEQRSHASEARKSDAIVGHRPEDRLRATQLGHPDRQAPVRSANFPIRATGCTIVRLQRRCCDGLKALSAGSPFQCLTPALFADGSPANYCDTHGAYLPRAPSLPPWPTLITVVFDPPASGIAGCDPETNKRKRPAIGKNRREARTTSLASTSVVKALWPRALTIR